MKKTSKKAPVISHDCNGRKIYADSIVKDTEANEYFIPVKKNGQYVDYFMGDAYALIPKKLILIKAHATRDDLKELMQKSKDTNAVFNL